MKYLGVDLAWSTGGTGLALVNSTGALVASTRVVTDTEIDAWIANMAGQPLVVAVDAPLVVPNDAGARAGEREVNRAYNRFGAAPYSSSRAMLAEVPTRALRLAERHGWDVDPAAPIGVGSTVCIEVYPHPALVALFHLPYRLDYKKGSHAERRAGLEQLVGLLESVPELRFSETARWAEIRRIVEDPAPGELGRLEDELDAVVCAHLAWLWHQHPTTLQVYGSLAAGYIVAPPPPGHAAVPVTRRRKRAGSVVVVDGPPPEPDGVAAWREALAGALVGIAVPADRLSVEIDVWSAEGRVADDELPVEELVAACVAELRGALRRSGGEPRLDKVTATLRDGSEAGKGPAVRIRVRPVRSRADGR